LWDEAELVGLAESEFRVRCFQPLGHHSLEHHAGSVSFFRSNQPLTFAKIRLSATDEALDAHD
jgi:hypothetical protein